MDLNLEQLINTQKALEMASASVQKTLEDITNSYRANVVKLLQAIELTQQNQAKALQDVGNILEAILKK